MFVTRERSYRGKYTVRLYSNWQERWVHITVDDRIPCVDRGDGVWVPVYAQVRPEAQAEHKNTIWTLVLEKAFAK